MSLLQEMLDYCERTGTPTTYLGSKTVGDSTLIAQMHKGRVVTERNASRIRAIMAKRPEGFHPPRPSVNCNPNAAGDNRTPWEFAADMRAGSIRLLEATAEMAPASKPARKLTHEEKLALVMAGKARLVPATLPPRSYSYSLTGGSLD